MTKPFRKLIQRSGDFLRRMLGKPAWDFNRFVAEPRQKKGRRWQLKTLMQTLLRGLSDQPEQSAQRRDDD